MVMLVRTSAWVVMWVAGGAQPELSHGRRLLMKGPSKGRTAGPHTDALGKALDSGNAPSSRLALLLGSEVAMGHAVGAPLEVEVRVKWYEEVLVLNW